MGTEHVAEGVGALRAVSLPGGDRLVIRPARAADIDGIVALYDGLDADDRYRRFFGVYRPPRSFFEGMVTAADRGGLELVALVVGAESGATIVAEAGYNLLPDGDGELALAVARGWRGWLGPYLLDALLEAAAARGVPNLEADVLVSNGPMLALLRARGDAVMDHSDWSVLRVLVATAGRTPSWPAGHDQPRVLVEVPGGRWHGAAAARAAGLYVIACPGPAGKNSHCPVLAGERCPLAAGADAIVVSPRPDDERWDALPEAHERLHRGVPVCLEVLAESTNVASGVGERRRVPAGDEAAVAFVEALARGHRCDAPPPASRAATGDDDPQ